MRDLIIFLAVVFVGGPIAYAIFEWLLGVGDPPPPRPKSPEDEASDAAERRYCEQMKNAPPTSPEEQKRRQIQRIQEWQGQWNRFEYGFDLGGPHRQDDD